MTHADLQVAIRKFEESGGVVKKLPDSCNPVLRPVGVHYGAYESVISETGFPWNPGGSPDSDATEGVTQ